VLNDNRVRSMQDDKLAFAAVVYREACAGGQTATATMRRYVQTAIDFAQAPPKPLTIEGGSFTLLPIAASAYPTKGGHSNHTVTFGADATAEDWQWSVGGGHPQYEALQAVVASVHGTERSLYFHDETTETNI